MRRFFGIGPGEKKAAPGLCAIVSEDGERLYLSGHQCGFTGGKWFDLADDHAVVWLDEKQTVTFIRPDGKALRLGQFPAWVATGSAKRNPATAILLNFAQFEGGEVHIA